MINRKYGNTVKVGIKDKRVKFTQDSPILESEFYRGKPRRHNSRALKVINRIAKTMNKTAAAASGCSSRGDTMLSSPMFYHPEYEPSSLLMPRDPIEINAWSRYFYKYDAMVSTAVDAHAELPISTIRYTMPTGTDRKKCEAIREEYEEMCSTEYLDLFNKLLQIGVEYYKLGNVFPFAQWSEQKKKWVKLTLLDPDYVEVDKLQFSNRMRVDLRPNDRLKEVVHNGPDHPKTGMLFQVIPEDVRELILTNKKIPLNTNPDTGSHIAHISYKMADYDTIGTGLIERNFKPLVYKDRLRQAQDAVAARHLTPKHLIWAEYMSNADTEAIRAQIDNAFADPDYAIITNFELHWELIGTGQSMMQLDSEWNWINEELMIGMMINRSFLLGEGGFANGQTVLEVMNQRYSIYRERIENYIIQYLFRPMAKRNDWAEYVPGTLKKEKKVRWLYPRIKWNRLNFVDDTAHKQMLSQMVNAGQIDMETWLEAFGLDAQTIADRLKRWEGTVLDVNTFEEGRATAGEIGRILAPAIAKIRAEQRGINLPKETEGAMDRFGSDDKMKKTAESAIEKTAETRDQREFERNLQKTRKEYEDKNKELQVPLEKNVKPPRKDLKSPKLFESAVNNDGFDEIPFLNVEKAEEIITGVKQAEKAKDIWAEKLIKSSLDSNSRRAVLALENDILEMNGTSTSKDRIHVLKKYLPQIFASKVVTPLQLSLMQKVDMAKKQFENEISSMSFGMESALSKAQTQRDKARIIRSKISELLEIKESR